MTGVEFGRGHLMISGLTGENDEVVLRGPVRRGRGVANRQQAVEMLAVDATGAPRAAEWYRALVEEVSDYAVFEEAPAGSISMCTAEWLISELAVDGALRFPAGLEVVIRCMEKSDWSPPALSAFALGQVARAVIDGDGGRIGAGRLLPGIVERPEVERLRRILSAFGGNGRCAVTRAEADILLEINDRTVEEMNHPAWNDLFVKAIASVIFAASGYATPPRHEALRREPVLDHPDADVAAYFARMISGRLDGLLDLYRAGSAPERKPLADPAEARWLAERLSRDRLLHDNERALFAMIARGPSRIHPDFGSLLAKLG